jgi:hypothetical protein
MPVAKLSFPVGEPFNIRIFIV